MSEQLETLDLGTVLLRTTRLEPEQLQIRPVVKVVESIAQLNPK